jgi:DnaJ-class molecular chaperone
MRDPYLVLGVKRDAGAEEIKRAFRKLAKTWHPDHNSGDPKAKERFAEINAAYEILGDAARRRQFDRGEIDAEGKPRATFHPGFDPAGQGTAGGFRFDFGADAAPGGRSDPRDIFSDLFRRFETGGADPRAGAGARPGGAAGGRSAIPPGEDIELEAAVPLETIAQGGTVRLTLPDLRMLEAKVPAGAANGSTMRLRGQGQPSPFGGPNGDALVTIRYQRHPRFTLDGADLRISVPVPLREAILGGSVRVPTLAGEVEVTVPPWTSGGKALRLRGKGLPLKERAGDLFVTLDIDLGPNDPEIEGFFRRRRS